VLHSASEAVEFVSSRSKRALGFGVLASCFEAQQRRSDANLRCGARIVPLGETFGCVTEMALALTDQPIEHIFWHRHLTRGILPIFCCRTLQAGRFR
jgi:hypothetical protein